MLHENLKFYLKVI